MIAKLKFNKPENSTVEYGSGTIELLKPANYASYQRDAKKILDKLSKDFTPQGIDFLMTALIEAVNDEYYGRENQ